MVLIDEILRYILFVLLARLQRTVAECHGVYSLWKILFDSVQFCLTSPRVLAGLLATCGLSYFSCIVNGHLTHLCEMFSSIASSCTTVQKSSRRSIVPPEASGSDSTVSCFVSTKTAAPNKSGNDDDDTGEEETEEECRDGGNADENPDMEEEAAEEEEQSDSHNARRKRKSGPAAEFCPKRLRSLDEHEKRVGDSKVEQRGNVDPSASCDPPKLFELSEGLAARLVELGTCPGEGCPGERNVNRSESGIGPWNLLHYHPDGSSDVLTPEANRPDSDEAPKLTRSKKTFSRLTDEEGGPPPRSSCMWTPGELRRTPNHGEQPEIITLGDEEPRMPVLLDCSVAADVSVGESSKLGLLSQMDCDEMNLDLQLMIYRDIQSSQHRLFADPPHAEDLRSSDVCPEDAAHSNLPREHEGETSAEDAYRPTRRRNYPGIAEQPLHVKKDARFQKRFYKKDRVVLPRKLGKAIRQAVSPESHPNELEEHRSRTLSEEEQIARLERQAQRRRYIEQCLEELNRSASNSDSQRRERSPSSSPPPDDGKQEDESVQASSTKDRGQSADLTFEATTKSSAEGPPATQLTPPPSPSNLPLKARKYWAQSITHPTYAKSKLTSKPEIIKISSAETPQTLPERISPDSSPDDGTATLAPFELHQEESASLEIVHVVSGEIALSLVEAHSTGTECYSTESGETEKIAVPGAAGRIQDTCHLRGGEFCTTEGEAVKFAATASDPSSSQSLGTSLDIVQVGEDESEQILDFSEGGSVTEGEE